ncbi:S-layer homology domain-containing protein [Pseudoneobacillus sp. C159]
MKKLLKVAVTAALLFGIYPGKDTEAAGPYPGKMNNELQVSSGVVYGNVTYQTSNNQSMNILDINLADPFTKVEVGIPSPLNKLMTTTSRANLPRTDNNRVVGAINGSFFESRMPMYLIAKDNALYNGGIISTGTDKYVNEPIAFGITADGKAEIDYFQLNNRIQFNNINSPISGFNRIRNSDELIVYTPSFGDGNTNTNQYGTELVVVTDQPSISEPVKFGDQLTGTIQQIRPYGDTTNTKIPANGFVVSFNGKMWNDRMAGYKIGDKMTVSFAIDTKWMNAQFLLASGPMLVKDSKPFLTIDLNSSRAREVTARTAVAIDSSKNRVFFVTVDGRQPGFSTGMNLKDFADYLVKLGADRAINLDGGGSTTLATRLYGQNQVSLMNSPSDGNERAVSTILQAVSTAPLGEPTQMKASRKQQGKLLVGSTLDINVDYVLDQYFNSLTVNPKDVKISIPSQIATATGTKVTGAVKGDGKMVVQYGKAVTELPLTVVDSIDQFKLNRENPVLQQGQIHKFTASAFDATGQPLIYNQNLVEWSLSGEIGSISKDGTLTTIKKGTGIVTAKYGQSTVSTSVTVTDEPILVDDFEDSTKWTVSTARANATMKTVQNPEPVKNGTSAMKLEYDFTTADTGTKAAYLNGKFTVDGSPLKLGLWVYGDGQSHWLRGKIADSAGKSHTLNFTDEGKLNWSGWKYVEAAIPTAAVGPITIQQIYLAESVLEKQGKGAIYLDKLQAIFLSDYQEPMFSDVKGKFWAKTEIEYLASQGIISGYPNGTFLPENKLTRAHAAVLLSRALNLDTKNVKDISYTDVPKTHPYYAQIAAVVGSKIMSGKGNGIFDPEGNLTRAQMSAILVNAYSLSGTYEKGFSDVTPDYWASKQIQALAANGITTGYPDGTFKPGGTVTRVQYSAFLYRLLTKNKQ